MRTNPNDASYPTTTLDFDGRTGSFISRKEYGLTKLEAFTMAAMQGICANPHSPEDLTNQNIATLSVTLAKATIAALNNEREVSNG